jgi:putative DNA primase/helicase
MYPGIKYDHIMILEGPQGIGKSTFVSILAGPWGSDSLGDISNKDVVDNMRGKWLIEIGELASMNRAEANELKAFITRQNDVARKAYGKRSQTYPRQCVFVGTTNEDEYLKDATGGRRFWCAKTTKFRLNDLRRDRDQLWAEAYAAYSLGEALYLDDDKVRHYAEAEQLGRFIVDEIQTQVAEILADDEFPNQFTFEDLWGRLALNEGKHSKKICDYPMQIRIKKALRVIGCPKVRSRSKGRAYSWLKKDLKDTSYKSY